MSASLPQELVDKVIDNLPNDVESLRACSCVSSSFRRRSQQRIFARVTISPPKTDENVTPCQKFHKLLVSSPHLTPLIKSLEIVDGECQWLAKQHHPLDLILNLLHLQRISIRSTYRINFSIEKLSSSLRLSLLEVFRSPALISLNLGVITISLSDFHFLLDNCRGLKELSVCGVNIWTLDDEIPALGVPPTQLESLSLEAFRPPPLKHLLALTDLTCLCNLTVIHIFNQQYMDDLVEATSRTLYHLRLILIFCESGFL